MSTFNEIDITCDNCGKEYKGVVWTAVHAAQDPELKEILLGGELNLLMCPDCAHVAYQDHFVLYQDPVAELIAYIYPPSQKADEPFLRETTMANFKEAQAVYDPKDRKDYSPIIMFGLDTFVEMMHQEDTRAAQSHVAEALCKEYAIPYTLLRPSTARRLVTMRVLPMYPAMKDPSRSDILAGLVKLLAINPTLDLYSQLQKQIQNDEGWKIK